MKINNVIRAGFINNIIASKMIGDGAVYLLFALIGIASYYDKIWTQIPIIERFVYVPWLFFVYAYYLISKYEKAHGIIKNKIDCKEENYSYALYWGIIFMAIHYIYIPFTLNPELTNSVIADRIFQFYQAINDINRNIGATSLKKATPVWEFLGVCIALIGSAKAGLARIYLNGYWAKDVYDYGKENRVIKNGPYSRVRHPIYSGQIFLVLGTAMASCDIIMYIWVAVVFALNRKRATVEEDALIKIFEKGDGNNEYREYISKVKYFMINKLY